MELDWAKKHVLKVANKIVCQDDIPDTEIDIHRNSVEPWLTAVFQSDHLSLLAGSGLTTAVASVAGSTSKDMGRVVFNEYKDAIKKAADSQAKNMVRGKANFEDDLRVAIDLCRGLEIQGDDGASKLIKEIDAHFTGFIQQVLESEKQFLTGRNYSQALAYLKSFLVSFASRTAPRDRLQVFTTNYDRFIEYGFDMAGILSLDRYIGKINPVFRTTRLELDYHYNPPGIRGEPRYVEGVVKYTKLHGSLDWKFCDGQIVKSLLPFGAEKNHPGIPETPSTQAVIYPNSAKDMETAFYPYSELFREFSRAVCQPNSVVVTYGYGFGDSHINRILEELLTIPSTHLVIISWDDADGRIKTFVENNNESQFTLLIGDHFGDLKTIVDNYLPKAAIDRITERRQKILEKRGKASGNTSDDLK